MQLGLDRRHRANKSLDALSQLLTYGITALEQALSSYQLGFFCIRWLDADW